MNTVSIYSPECVMCGKRTELILPVGGWENYKAGMLVQKAFPDMSIEDREMIITGTHPECWNVMCEGMDEEEWIEIDGE